ncbi:putative forkhead domain-containing protein [Diaporthe ampelina]|uniref:Putative forkhead domain-containing protein n=1 Tax=Diaporthe ampelina TaxID=1214573 RepID=A0A0G2I5K8_9PEZI|nr:putative forkhead domain-containing protein [Diaporthe ampelina]
MARLEFADTFVAITTNTTIIGRDQRVYKRAVMNKKRAEGGLSPVSKAIPVKRGIYSKSYVSQEGGALGPESDGEERSRSSKRQQETPAADDPSAPDNVISSRQYVDHTPGAVPVDMDILRPSSDDVARIDIHGAGPDIIETSKGISRDHLKIQYDEDNRVWQATAIGRNGFFCEEKLYHKDEVVTLRSGSHLQIQAVGFIFTISGVEDGKFGNEQPSAYFEDGKKMSLDFSNSRAEDDMRDTDDEESIPARIPNATAMLDTDDSDDSDGGADRSASPKPAANAGALEAEPEGSIRPTIESDPVKETTRSVEPDASQAMVPPKKRGPGRPPKNGVMSKREERELKKKREEEDKKNNPPQEPGEPPIKRKVGRPRKHPRPEDEGDQPEKRKYKPRKPKNEDGEDEEDPEGDKADKQKRLQKPKTPPLDLGKREDWPEEKLQKPPKNYQTLIDEVLTSAAPDGLTLKQIYKRIATNYPFYYFCVDTKAATSTDL